MLAGFLSPMQPEPDGASMSLMFLPAKILVSDSYWLVVSPFSRARRLAFPVRHRAIYRRFGRKATPKNAQEVESTK